MKFAERIDKLQPYLFVEISRKINQKRAAGIDVITFAIGDPDIPTPPHILDKLIEAAQDPPNHRYPESDGLPQFRRAVAELVRQAVRHSPGLPTKRCCPSLVPKRESATWLSAS